ncbi:MAG: hypothetical protein Q9183_003623 [Haloplaca sp. 2 TL-2023]
MDSAETVGHNVGTLGVHDHVAKDDLSGSMPTSYDNTGKNVAIPGTVGIYNHTTEVLPLGSMPTSCDNNDKSVAIPGTVGIFNQTTEVEHSKLAFHDQNEKNAAIPGSVGVFAHTTEIDHVHDMTKTSDGFGTLHLRGESLPRPLTREQCDYYKTNGYLIIPNATTTEEATKLGNTAHDVMMRVFEGGEGIIRHDISENDGNALSPIGRIIATFEPGSSAKKPDSHRAPPLILQCRRQNSFLSFQTSRFPPWLRCP